MSGVKHTPGRWTFNNDSMTGAVWAEKEFIASVYPNAPEGWDGASEYERLDEMRANARLIAAAPDMFDDVLSSAQNGCATAQQIIARARGEQDGGGE